MNNQRKYETMALSPKSKAKKRLLRTLVSSVMCLILSCSMLLGTTMAWFTDTVEVSGNQINTGTLQVKALMNRNGTTTDLGADGAPPLFGEEIIWLPDHTEIRNVQISNEGNLDLRYIVNLALKTDDASIAQYFDVYVIDEFDSTATADEGGDVLDGWTFIGSLSDISARGASLMDSKLKAKANCREATDTYVNDIGIAIRMDSDASNDTQGKKLSMALKLNAYQDDIPDSETQFENYTKTYEGTVEEPISFPGGTLVLDNVTMTTTADAPAIKITGNTKIVVNGTASVTAPLNQSAIYVNKGVKLDISGDTLTAIGNGGADGGNGGHGIGGYGTIYIHDLSSLTAKGFGHQAFGIGGPTSSITIEDTTIETVQGGYVQPDFVNDSKYGKTEPEGGAAIGSQIDGAVITLKNVTVKDAKGGSKAAGIGAMYWTGVTVNITDCDIQNVEGGNASAGIGGSRVSDEEGTAQNVTINIHDSKVTAKGGQFAAGIGSGYDTHCTEPAKAPMHTINITGDSVINATGGQYGAGIGTGYHVAGLSGKIDSTVTVNAKNGGSREKYTEAMDVGFGVIDKTREAVDATFSSFDYKGTVITISSAPDVAASSATE